jgi:hypothetical protein
VRAGNQVTQKQLLAEFFDAGLDVPPDWTWSDVRRYLGIGGALRTKTVGPKAVVGHVFFEEHVANGPEDGLLRSLEMRGTALAWLRLFRHLA